MSLITEPISPPRAISPLIQANDSPTRHCADLASNSQGKILAAMQVTSICKRFGAVEALKGASFTLSKGERLALLGPNGAGKTTLIRCLAGRTKPDSGKIELMGRQLPSSGGRERLGLVPQDFALYGDLTTQENLVAFARFHGLRGRLLQERVQWALGWTGLAARKHDLVGGFSGGMKRRVNLACGVMHGPQVLLLDEPTVGVDPQSRQRIFQMLDELHEIGTSILLTTHHLEEAEQRCDRIVIVDGGTVIASGTLAELIRATIGEQRHVQLRIDRTLHTPPKPWKLGREAFIGNSMAGSVAGSDLLETRVNDVAGQLPVLLKHIREMGLAVLNVEVRAPSLHDVFLHLTGQELRD